MTLDISNRQAKIISQQVAIRNQLQPLSNRVVLLQSSVEAAQEKATNLQAEQKLMALLNRGELFDKDAFQELQGIASGTNGTTNIAPLAKAMFNKLQRTLLIDRAQDGRVIINSEAFGSLTSDEIADALETAKSPELDAIVNTMGKQPLFVSRLVELAHQSKDLWTINRIAKSLNEMTGVNFYPWDLQPLNNWWARNSSKYTNWPVEHFRNALQEVASAHYQAALTNFEFVVAIDPTADKSRALAVGCAIEVGNMSKAQQLNTNFAIANGRWEHWARGKMMLATNAVRQGTEEFVSLAKKYPGFVGDGLIHEGNHVLRQVDWPLYRELMVATTNTASGNTNAAP